MRIDTTTLMVAGSVTTALAGLLLIAVWTQIRHATALLWWGVAQVFYAVGLALLTSGLAGGGIFLLAAGSIVADIAPPFIWIGARVFARRRTPTLVVASGMAVYLALDVGFAVLGQRPLIGFIGWIVCLTAAGGELWLTRPERLTARLPLLVVFAIQSFVFIGGVFSFIYGDLTSTKVPPLFSWFGAINFESMFFAMPSAVFMALLCRERETQHYIRVAGTDSLTGVANHGALMDSARRLFERSRRDATRYSLIMFDLDHFKAINDLHGHRAGDHILNAFADTVRGVLRPTDFFGRYGGEEFAVILPGATVETAGVIAERVRHAFAQSHRFLNGQQLNATVSAGVAEAVADMSFEDTIDGADRAMYEAKRLGRNRVERAGGHGLDGDRNAIIRIA